MLLTRNLRLLLLMLLLTLCVSSTQAITVQVPYDVLSDYKAFVQGRDVTLITDYNSDYARRDVIDMVLFEQALRLGGFDGELRFLEVPEGSYIRLGRVLRQGRVVAMGTTVWKSGIDASDDRVLMTAPLVRQGEFEVGLYSTPDKIKQLSILPLSELVHYRVVSNRNWVQDWDTLSRLGFDHIIHADQWMTMVQMLSRDRADITLAPFHPGEGMAIEVDSTRLLPLPHRKVRFNGSRHWVVSATHANGVQTFRQLQGGLSILRQQKRVTKAYRQSGFFHPEVKGWTVINSPLSPQK